MFFFLRIRRPPRSTLDRSSAASDVYKRQGKINLMPETNKGSKGIQISKIAKEVNRQSSEILEYLKRIGVEVGGVMSKVDEGAYHKVLGLSLIHISEPTRPY